MSLICPVHYDWAGLPEIREILSGIVVRRAASILSKVDTGLSGT